MATVCLQNANTLAANTHTLLCDVNYRLYVAQSQNFFYVWRHQKKIFYYIGLFWLVIGLEILLQTNNFSLLV